MNYITSRLNNLYIDETPRYSHYDFNTKYVLSIDIGILHLGLTFSSINENFTLREIIWFDLINITNFACDRKKCLLYHDKTMTDYLEHVFFEHGELFGAASWILIERQPPVGLVAVEQLIFSKYRNKAILVSPNSMHCHFGWNVLNLDYETRKIYSSKVAADQLKNENRAYLLTNFLSLKRNHDVADSICQMLFWLYVKNKEWNVRQNDIRLEKKIEQARQTGAFHSDLYLEKFKYVPKINF
jgi:hypothetical protein